MYHILPESKRNVIAIRVEGYMRNQDYQSLLPFIEELIKKHGTIRILMDLRDCEGADFRGVLKVLPHAFRLSPKVGKEAIITDVKWIPLLVKLAGSFFKTEVRCFQSTETSKAWIWIKK